MAVSPHETCEKQEERNSINLFSNLFFVKLRNYAASTSFADVLEEDMSLSISEINIYVSADSMKNYNVSEFLSQMFLARDAEIRWVFFILLFI